MKITKHKEECYTIDEYVKEEECIKIISYVEGLYKNNILEWNRISFYDSFAMGFWEQDPTGFCQALGLPIDYFHGELKTKLKKAVELVLERDVEEVSYHAQKWEPGAFAGFHSDNSDEDGNPSEFEKSKYAAFLYLNEDFSGGVLNFKNHDITIKPKTGTLAVFAGGYTNEHEVTKVHDGTRYTVGSFWDYAELSYSEEQIKEREERLKKTRAEQDELYKHWELEKKIGIVPDYVGKNGER